MTRHTSTITAPLLYASYSKTGKLSTFTDSTSNILIFWLSFSLTSLQIKSRVLTVAQCSPAPPRLCPPLSPLFHHPLRSCHRGLQAVPPLISTTGLIPSATYQFLLVTILHFDIMNTLHWSSYLPEELHPVGLLSYLHRRACHHLPRSSREYPRLSNHFQHTSFSSTLVSNHNNLTIEQITSIPIFKYKLIFK